MKLWKYNFMKHSELFIKQIQKLIQKILLK